MRKTFQKWLLLFVTIAFFVTFFVSFWIQTRQARNSGINLIRLKIEDMKKQLEINDENLFAIRQMTSKAALAKARAFSQMLVTDKALANNCEKLRACCETLDVDEIHVINGSGIISGSSIVEYIGYDMASATQSAYFMQILTNPGAELIQSPQAIGYDSRKIMQYAGVHRRDADGFVQIGYVPQRLREAMEIADIKNLPAGFRIGNEGELIVVQDGKIISVGNQYYLGKGIERYGITERMLNNKNGFYTNIANKKYVGIAEDYNDYTIIGIMPSNEIYFSRNGMAVFLIVCNFILFAVVFVLVSILVQRVVIDGIYSVNNSLSKITEGDLDEQVSVRTNQEFTALSDGINSTVDALKTAISEAAARIDKELEFAKAIQCSSLPNIFPPYPDHNEFDIYANMHTAKEVGGDFYDFYLVDDDHLAVLIADVSGKGIPAALFMMTSKALIKSLIESGKTPHEAFILANNELCDGNDAGMFVTAFLGILELSTGKFTYVNAGHNQPLLKRAGGKYEWLQTKAGFVLAGMQGMIYQEFETTFNPGDRLLLYTDGVTEALNKDEELFGDARLEEVLNSAESQNTTVTELLGKIKLALDEFALGVEQADDITMLALEYKGK